MSKLEAECAMNLDFRLKARKGDPLKIIWWKRQIRVPLDIGKHHICDYIVDFQYKKEDGTIVYQEAKGIETDVYKIKRKLFEALVLSDSKGIEYEVIKR